MADWAEKFNRMISSRLFAVGEEMKEASLPALPVVVEQARQEWLAAQRYYSSVTDADLVDYAVYLMQAAEKKYMYLLKQARREGVTYSPFKTKNINID